MASWDSASQHFASLAYRIPHPRHGFCAELADPGTWEAELGPKVTQRLSSEIQRIKYNFTKAIQESTASLKPSRSFVTAFRRDGNTHPVVPTHIPSLYELVAVPNLYL